MEAASPKKRKQLAIDDLPAIQTQRRKKKKEKRGGRELQLAGAPTPTAQQPIGQKAEKPPKKKRKIERQQDTGAAPVHNVSAVAEPAQANGLHSPDTTSNKSNKKKQKRQAPKQQNAAAAGADSSVPVPDTKPLAAKAAADSALAAIRAVVGDQDLADSLPPIVKHLYQEAPSIAALTASEVDSWRTERATGLKGCDLNPVMTFKDAGVHARIRLCILPCVWTMTAADKSLRHMCRHTCLLTWRLMATRSPRRVVL